jgi:hypothetical protein
MIRLSADQNPAKQQGGDEFDRYKSRPRVMGRASDPQNEKAKTARSQERARKIEGMRRSRGTRQCLQTDQNRNKFFYDVPLFSEA